MTGPATSHTSLEAICGAFLGLCTFTVALRFTARKWQSARYGPDDWVMLASLLFFYGLCVCVIGLVRIGAVGWGAFPFPESDFPHVVEEEVPWIVASDVTQNLVFACTKISALLLYRRIFCPDTKYNRKLRWTIDITMMVVIAWLITFCFIGGFQCKGDWHKIWLPKVHAAHCGTLGTVYAYGNYVSDLILDTWVVLLPIPKIIGLQMPIKTKLSIIGAFGIAFVGIAASILRLVIFLQIAILKTRISRVSDTENFDSYIYFYIVLEAGMMMIAINVPVFWSLFTKLTPRVLSSEASITKTDASGEAVEMDNVYVPPHTTTMSRNPEDQV